MPALSLDKVNKYYPTGRGQSVHAVKDISLHADEGEIIALLGSSGCGKTSTLRMIAGFEAVSDGTIRLGERRLNDLRPADRNVGMAFEGYALYPPLSVFENIAFALKRARLSRSDIDARVRDIVERLEISDILERRPLGLSGGQQQRVSLARALIRTPDLYLLDEPMSQLEPQLRAVLRSRVKEWLLRQNVTTVFVTHDQTEALALADRVAVMEGGVLQQYGSPFELESRPVNLFVGAFIGEPPMNTVAARVTRSDGDRVELALGEGGVTVSFTAAELPDALRGILTAERSLYIGVRAHRLRLAAAGGGAGSLAIGEGSMEAEVLSNQWLGDQSHLALAAGGHTWVVVTEQPQPFRSGDRARLVVPQSHLHVFDGRTEEALFHGAAAQHMSEEASTFAAEAAS